MNSYGQMVPEDWQTLHNELRDGLQNEIRLTRELLSNMHQEEVSLMLHDTGSLNQILQQRSQMLERLSTLRLRRLQTTERIEKIATVGHKHPSLEEILPPSEEISTEILSLSDQLMALTERMNRQHTQNQRLSEHGDHHRYPPRQMTPEARPKRKASVATYHIKK
ncbi:MAG: flagellar export chaperone FlgN [Verrucomicrobia bacterium]|nr:flagellar export chaperone FlgN [Verrucomicrobiota bacterium]